MQPQRFWDVPRAGSWGEVMLVEMQVLTPPLLRLQIIAGSLWSRVSQVRSLFFSLQYLLPLGLAIITDIADKMQGKEIPGRWHLSPVEWQDSSLPFKYKELVKRKIV